MNIVVECKPDERLVRVLGMSRKQVAHQSNKGEVCNHLEKSKIPLAIIDEDPGSGQPKILSKYRLIEECHGIRKLQSPTAKQVILVLKPRLEEWLLERCRASGINPEDFYLPANNKRLKDTINYKLDDLENLVKELLNKQDQGILYLKRELRLAK